MPPCSELSPQPSYFLSKQKTLVCLGKWTAHIPVKIHIEPCRASEHSKEEKLNSSTNAYLFPILAPSHNTLLLVSQHEAVISLASECMCMLTVEVFSDKKQYVVLCRGCLSFLALNSITGNRLGDGIDSPSLLFQLGVYTQMHTHLLHPNKASRNECYLSDAAKSMCVLTCCAL